MITGLNAFLSSSLWLRFILGLLYLFYAQVVTNQYKIPYQTGLRAIGLILIGRELLSALIPGSVLFVFSEIWIFIILATWVSHYTERTKPNRLVMYITIPLLIATEITGRILNLPGIFTISQNAVLLGMVAYLGLKMNDLSVYNAKNPEFIIENKAAIFLALLIPRGTMVFIPTYTGAFIEFFLLPLGFLPYFIIIYSYQKFYHQELIEMEEFNNSYINSLFDFMRTIGSAMTQRIEVKSILEYVVRTIVKHTEAEAGAVFLRDTERNVLTLGVVQGYYPPPFPVPAIAKAKLSGIERYFENTPIQIGETILGEAAANNTGIFIRKTQDDPRMDINTKDDTLFISSLMAVPLTVNREVFGVLSIIHRSREQLFSPLDFERFKIFAEYASLTLDSLYNYSQLLEKQEIEREVNIAGEIQTKLLPGRIPLKIRKQVAAFSKPAKGVSGDYYDIIPLTRAGKMGYVICDVAGKGVPASLIMVMIRTIVHLIAGSTKDASKVLTWINKGIAGSIDIERFATLSYFTYDPATGELEYSNAGHHPLVILRKTARIVEKLDAPGLPIGLERDALYERRTAHLQSGDVVMVYTDGIIEAMNPQGEQYEEERLSKVFIDNVHLEAADLLNAIRSDIDTFVDTAKQHDDQTLIIMKA